MKSFNSLLSFSTVAIAISASLAAADVGAVIQTRNSVTTAAGICQPAINDAKLRMRTLSVANEDKGSWYVTCAFTSDGAIVRATVWASTQDGSAHNLTCVGISGFQTGANQYVVKQASLSANGGRSAMQWNTADFSGNSRSFPGEGRFSVSCALPPGVGINDAELEFREDVGM